jgi:hypothetical protein
MSITTIAVREFWHEPLVDVGLEAVAVRPAEYHRRDHTSET